MYENEVAQKVSNLLKSLESQIKSFKFNGT